MSAGLAITFSVLEKTKNEAATSLLATQIESSDRQIQASVIKALQERRSSDGHTAILRHWHTLCENLKRLVDKSGRMTIALRDAILSSDKQLVTNACDVIVHCREYDLIPALITAAEDKSNKGATLAAETVLALSEALHEELAAPRDYQNRRDPQLVRRYFVGSLETSIGRFERHKRREILEAFLLLASHANAVLNHILRHPHDARYVTIVHLLSRSDRPGIIRVLLNYLDDAGTPPSIASMIVRRHDVTFVRQLLRKFADQVPQAARSQLARIAEFRWLRDDMSLLSTLSDEEQRGAINVTMASGMDREHVLDVVRFILTQGTVGARRVAARMLTKFSGHSTNDLILHAVRDQDPVVQATAIPLLRHQFIQGAMTELLKLLDSPHPEVREAVRQSLSEFTFDRYSTTFETLNDLAKQEMGRVVARVDPQSAALLKEEFASEIRIRRLRAVRMAVAMNTATQHELQLIELLSDEDHILRSEAAAALAGSDTMRSRQALRDALFDRSAIVREAAEQTLQTIVGGDSHDTTTPRAPIQMDSADALLGGEPNSQ